MCAIFILYVGQITSALSNIIVKYVITKHLLFRCRIRTLHAAFVLCLPAILWSAKLIYLEPALLAPLW